jgi:hypothetical protein
MFEGNFVFLMQICLVLEKISKLTSIGLLKNLNDVGMIVFFSQLQGGSAFAIQGVSIGSNLDQSFQSL